MGISIQRRRGTEEESLVFTGKLGEVTVDTTQWSLRVHDGTTAGGILLSRADHGHSIASDTVPGFMSPEDRIKLDSIAGGSASYQLLQFNGKDQPQRQNLNVTANFSVMDDEAGKRTTIDLSDTGVAQGVYTKVTVTPKGRVAAGGPLTAEDIPNLPTSKIADLAKAVHAVRLDQLQPPKSDLNVNSNKLINVSEPVAGSDAATKNYVDNMAVGLSFKTACRAASTSNVNLNAPGTSIDTVKVAPGDRVLVKDQTDKTQNGLYIWNGPSKPMTRSLDAQNFGDLKTGAFVFIGPEGSVNSDTAWVLSSNGSIVIGQTEIDFVQFSSSGNGLKSGYGLNISGGVATVRTASADRLAVDDSGVDLVPTGVKAGNYTEITVDAYGRVTSGNKKSFQPFHDQLTAVAGLASNGFVVRSASGAFAPRALQQGVGIVIVNGDGVAGNPEFSVKDDSTVQKVKFARNGVSVASRSQVNLIEGDGVTITASDNPATNSTDVKLTVATGGAPMAAPYLTLAPEKTLPNHRTLTTGTGLVMKLNDDEAELNLQGNLGTLKDPNVVLRVRRGSTAEHVKFVGAPAEVTLDTAKNTLVVHDGKTPGGIPLAKEAHRHAVGDVAGLTYQIVQVNNRDQEVRAKLHFTSHFEAVDDPKKDRTTIKLADNNTTGEGTYGSATQVAQVTVDSTGLVTEVKQVTISGVAPAGTATGDLTGDYPGPQVASVGGVKATDVAKSVADTKEATEEGTASKLVRRDRSGNFSANSITASLVGDVKGNVSGTAAAITGNLTGDVTSSGMVTTIAPSGVEADTYGSPVMVPQLTVNEKGQVTKALEVPIVGVGPGGPAGGDLKGNYPEPKVAFVGGVSASEIADMVADLSLAESRAVKETFVVRDMDGSAGFTRVMQAINKADTAEFDLSKGLIHQMTIKADTTVTVTNLVPGQLVVFDFVHDNTTNTYSLTWPANVFGGASGVGNMKGKHNRQLFFSDGFNLYSIGQLRND